MISEGEGGKRIKIWNLKNRLLKGVEGAAKGDKLKCWNMLEWLKVDGH